MSSLRTIPKTEWQTFFDRISRSLFGTKAEIEVASMDLGDNIVAEWIPMIGITYDSQDDLLDVAFDRTDHLIRHPTEIAVEEDDAGLKSVAVLDSEGARQIINLRTPLALLPALAHP